MKCTVDDCSKPPKPGRRMCSMHEARWSRHGSTEARQGGTLRERYERRVVRNQGCWGWTGYGNEHGYGHVGRQYAHRVAYRLFVGPIPRGLFVCHRCDNPPCTNPDHLFLGTAADNSADAKRKGRTRPGGGPGPKSRLTTAHVTAMRELRQRGQSSASIAAKFGISRNYVTQLIAGRKQVTR